MPFAAPGQTIVTRRKRRMVVGTASGGVAPSGKFFGSSTQTWGQAAPTFGAS